MSRGELKGKEALEEEKLTLEACCTPLGQFVGGDESITF